MDLTNNQEIILFPWVRVCIHMQVCSGGSRHLQQGGHGGAGETDGGSLFS